MVEIVRLEVDAERPSLAEDQPWLYIDQSDEGLFYGTGGSRKASGEWADRYNVPTIW